MSTADFIFLGILVASGLYACVYGGWEGRTLCAALTLAAFGTRFVIRSLGPVIGLPGATFAVDFPLLICLFAVAFYTDRYWPLWIVAFHLLSVLTFAAWVAMPGIHDRVFEEVASVWSLLIQAVLPIGVYLDRKAERRSHESAGSGANGASAGAKHPY